MIALCAIGLLATGWLGGVFFCNACDRYVSTEPTYLPTAKPDAE